MFFAPGQFAFGQPLYLSALIQTAQQVLGVVWVDMDPRSDPRVRFGQVGATPLDTMENVAAGRVEIGATEIAMVSNDPSKPAGGRIVFYVVEDR